jgi:hypothetical protein
MFVEMIFHVPKVLKEIFLNANKWSLKVLHFKNNFELGKFD